MRPCLHHCLLIFVLQMRMNLLFSIGCIKPHKSNASGISPDLLKQATPAVSELIADMFTTLLREVIAICQNVFGIVWWFQFIKVAKSYQSVIIISLFLLLLA